MKIIGDRPSNHTTSYFHTKFEVDPIKNTRKIRLLSVLLFGPILTLNFDLDPYLGMMVTNTLILLYAKDDVP
jgi:hypothetical protein